MILNFLANIISLFIGVIFTLIYGNIKTDKTEYKHKDGLSWFFLITKFTWKFLKSPGEGVINIDDNLVYVAEPGNADFPLIISPRNHKITVKNIRLDGEHINKYKTLCGYNIHDAIPICYAELLFTKPLIALVTSIKFCVSPIGLIHLRQTIKQFCCLDNIDTDITAVVQVKQYRENDRGVEIDILTQLHNYQQNCIWEGTTTLFSRKKSVPRKKNIKKQDEDYMFQEEVMVPGNCGVKYARLSDDWNPHHLYRWTSWFVGFSKPIAHGMWTLSKALSVILQKSGDQLDEKHEVICEFKRPLLMPSKIYIKYEDPNTAFYKQCKIKVEDVKTGVPHLVGTLKHL
ncbi:hypothetical protein ACF0H5_016182 [Mactra antiquata]